MDLMDACQDGGIVFIIKILKNALTIIQIVGPILAILSLGILFFKLATHKDTSEEKKLKGQIKNSIFALVLLFFIPLLINVLMGILADSGVVPNNFKVITCWDYADKYTYSKSTRYINRNSSNNKETVKVTIDPSEYQQGSSGVNPNGSSSGGNSMADAFVKLAVAQKQDSSAHGGQKYWSFMGFGGRVEWCACFVSWCLYNTEYGGQNLGDIYKYKSAGVEGFVSDCKSSSSKTYHDRGYTPKQGDIIFFDWDGGGPDHIGIVQKTENGNILTIEGNSSDAVNERTYGVNSNNVYGFCSWY